MLIIDQLGFVLDARVKRKHCPQIERGPIGTIQGIVVHQTGGPTSSSTLNSYAKPGAVGAHFLIDTDGLIYQTASLIKRTMHIGRLRARCLAEHRCTPVELRELKSFRPSAEHRREMKKSVPNRYPANHESIGIEIVGSFTVPKGKDAGEYGVYDRINSSQNVSLKWLVQALSSTFGIRMTEVFRHPTVSFKNRTEAASASW